MSSNYVNIIFPAGINADFAPAFENAAAFWNKAITSGLPPTTFEDSFRPWLCRTGTGYTFQKGDVIPGLSIFSQVKPIDGEGQILGSAGPCYLEGTMPYLGTMQFDSVDVQGLVDAEQFEAVIIHEMGHVVGIGGLWSTLNLVRNPCRESPCTTNPTYVGAGGIEGFQDLGGSGAVPVSDERGQGTWNAHWNEAYFDYELMTGFLNANSPNPLSVLSVKSLKDLGYTYNLDAVEEYTIPSEYARPLGGIKYEMVGDMLEIDAPQLKDAIREQIANDRGISYENEFVGTIMLMLIGFFGLGAVILANARAQRRAIEKLGVPQLPIQRPKIGKSVEP